jgi:tRNA uridine 5-carboxymethylaminomethyl modification enzyme
MVRAVVGLEDAEIGPAWLRVEYDYVDPTELRPTHGNEARCGVVSRGQINGNDRYEEAQDSD